MSSLRSLAYHAVLLLSACPAFAEPQRLSPGAVLSGLRELNFQKLPANLQLPHDSVYDFTQDSNGFLWIATFGGLSRFDGYRLKTWVHDPANPASLPDNNIRSVIAAEKGQLWVGTGSAGLVLFDPGSNTFRAPPNSPAFLKQARVFCLESDRNGGVWAGTERGLVHYDPRQAQWLVIGDAGEHPPGFLTGKIFSTLLARNGDLWVGGESGLVLRKQGSQTFTAVDGLPGDTELGVKPSVWALFEDGTGRIWVGSDGRGAGIVDASVGVVRGLPNIAGAESAIGTHTVRGFVEVSPGEIWIATYGGGLVTRDPATGYVRQWLSDPTALHPLANNFLRAIYRDQAGDVWLGSDNGLSRVNASARGIFDIHASPLRKHGLPGLEVRSVGAAGGRIWVGLDQGEFAVIEPTGIIRKVNPAPGVVGLGLSRREVLAIRSDADGSEVFAGGGGLYAINPRTMTYRPIGPPTLRRQIVNAISVESGAVWAGSYDGLLRYDRRTGQTRVFRHSNTDPSSLADNYIRDILNLKSGHVLITTRLGLDVLDPATGKFRHIRHRDDDPRSLATDNLQAMLQDAQGRIWIGTVGSGLTVLWEWTGGIGNPATEPVFRHIGPQDGLPSGIVLIVAEGRDGRIWANTPRGLAVIDPATFRVGIFTVADGLVSTTQNLFSSATLADGTIVFPGNAGITVVRPELLPRGPHTAPLAVSEIRLLGGAHPVEIASTINGPIRLNSRYQGLQVEFALLDFAGPEMARYAYRLEGFDGNWIDSTADRRVAAYTNLPPRSYTLSIRAAGREGRAPETVLHIPVEVEGAWYESWWFRILEVLAGLAFVLLLIRLRTTYLKRKSQDLAREVADRTRELESSRAELMNANLRLEVLATRDALTGLLNRRRFLEIAVEKLQSCVAGGPRIGIVLADIDHFKAINDLHGHIDGDRVIRAVAQSAESCFPLPCSVARYGGEEFIVLIPDANENSATLLAEEFRKTVLTTKVTISAGVAVWNGEASVDVLIDRADRALYAAKRQGRNQVTCSRLSDGAYTPTPLGLETQR